MKKLLLAAAVSTVASGALATENAFYVRADAGASFVPKHTFNAVKYKQSTSAVLALGVGTYLMDNVRTELSFAHHFNPKAKSKPAGSTEKLEASAVMLSGLVDVVDTGYGKLFVGAGVGVSQVSAKEVKAASSARAKKANNFAWQVGAGVGFDLSDGVMLDVAYNYSDLGKSKAIPGTTNKAHFKAHNVTAGVRVEL